MENSNLIYLLALLVVAVGLYAVLCKKNIIKIIVGILILDYGVNLFLILTGYRTDGIAPILTPEMDIRQFQNTAVDPVPQALVLTSIVIGLGITALMTALAIRLYDKYHSFDISDFRKLHG